MKAKSPVNVSNTERLFSVLGGSLLLYRSITGKHKSLSGTGLAAYLLYRGITGDCVLYRAYNKPPLPNPAHNINVESRIVVDRPIGEVYEFWRRLENLPLFMKHLRKVEEWSDCLSEWEAVIPGNLGTVRWKAEIVNQQPRHVIGWQSLQDSDIDNAGKVVFTELRENQTAIHAVITYRAPLGIVGAKAARLFTPVFENMVKEDLEGFKHYIETEEYLLLQRNNDVI